MIYLDHGATCPIDHRVKAVLEHSMDTLWANPSSLHRAGRAAKNAIETARLTVAAQYDLPMGKVFFTASGTEANNLAIFSAYRRRKTSTGHMITTAIEHESVLECARALEDKGVEVSYVAPNKDGVVSVEDVVRALRDDTFLVSIMAVNNEIGSIQPISEIKAALKGRVPLHVDAVQAAGHLPKSYYSEGDLFSMSAHKFYGPKGVGILVSNIPLSPMTLGGGQERGIRSGTENVPSIVAAAYALELAEENREKEAKHLCRLSETLKTGIKNIRGIRQSIQTADPRIVHFMVEDIEKDILLYQLDRRGIAASAGSACQAGASTKSHVLQALGIEKRHEAPLRLSLGKDNTLEEIESVICALKEILEGE